MGRYAVSAVLLISLLGVSCGPVASRKVSLSTPLTPPPARIELEDRPDEAAAFDRMKRVGAGEEIPIERYFTAIDHVKRMPVYSSAKRRFVDGPKTGGAKAASLGDWMELGPGNIGGRVSALLIRPDNPDVMYAGAVAGGVFRTTDGGASWTPLADLLPNIAVNAMAMDPQDPNVIYAGTGQWYAASGVRGEGILKTTDGGDTWTRLAGTAGILFNYVNKIVISPDDSRRVYAATLVGVMKSLDGGVTWTLALNRSSPNLGCQDLAIRTDKPTDYLFAACGASFNQATIFRNVDASGAGAWTSVHTEKNMARTTLALAPSNQNIIYALASSSEVGDFHDGLLAVFRSASSGDPDTWEARVRNSSPVPLNTAILSNAATLFARDCGRGGSAYNNQGFHANAIAVDPLDPDRVWAGGIDLYRSDDGGLNWGLASHWESDGFPQFVHADQKAIVFHPGFDGASNQTLYSANDGGVFRTRNARDGTGSGPRAACTPASSNILWASLNHNFGATQFYHGQVYPGGHLYIAGAQDNGTSRGSDATGIDGWQKVAGGDGGYVAIDPKDSNRIYYETTALSLRRSLDGGFTSSSATAGITDPGDNFLFITPFLIDPNESSRLWIGGRSVWRSNDGARAWSRAGTKVAGGSVSALAVAPGKPDRMLIGTSLGQIHRTDTALTADANTDWPFVQPRRGFVSSLAFDPSDPNVAYATYSTFNSGADVGHVFKSVDGGATWAPLDGQGAARIPDVPAECILVDPSNSAVLYLGTDLGVFVSLDGGASWAKEDTQFPNTMVETLAIDRNGGAPTLFAFTRGRGVWRVRLGGQSPDCVYALDQEEIVMPAFGGAASIAVSAQDGCAWSAASNAGWARPASPAGGAASGVLALGTMLNSERTLRTAVIAIADRKAVIRQNAADAPSGNDSIGAAVTVTSIPYVARLDLSLATGAPDDPIHSCTQSRDVKTVWFRFVAPSNGSVTAVASGAVANMGTVLTAYPFDGSIGPELTCIQRLAGPSEIRFAVTAGRSYAVELSGSGSSASGDVVFQLF